jgi:hypothetical protein
MAMAPRGVACARRDPGRQRANYVARFSVDRSGRCAAGDPNTRTRLICLDDEEPIIIRRYWWGVVSTVAAPKRAAGGRRVVRELGFRVRRWQHAQPRTCAATGVVVVGGEQTVQLRASPTSPRARVEAPRAQAQFPDGLSRLARIHFRPPTGSATATRGPEPKNCPGGANRSRAWRSDVSLTPSGTAPGAQPRRAQVFTRRQTGPGLLHHPSCSFALALLSPSPLAPAVRAARPARAGGAVA